MSCPICERNACAYWMHSAEQQERYKDVIAADMAVKILRNQVRDKEAEQDAKP